MGPSAGPTRENQSSRTASVAVQMRWLRPASMHACGRQQVTRHLRWPPKRSRAGRELVLRMHECDWWSGRADDAAGEGGRGVHTTGPWRRLPTRESTSEIVRCDRVSHTSPRPAAETGHPGATAPGAVRRSGGAASTCGGAAPSASAGGSPGRTSWGLVRLRPPRAASCVAAATSFESVLPEGSDVRRPPTADIMWRGDAGFAHGCIGSELGRLPCTCARTTDTPYDRWGHSSAVGADVLSMTSVRKSSSGFARLFATNEMGPAAKRQATDNRHYQFGPHQSASSVHSNHSELQLSQCHESHACVHVCMHHVDADAESASHLVDAAGGKPPDQEPMTNKHRSCHR